MVIAVGGRLSAVVLKRGKPALRGAEGMKELLSEIKYDANGLVPAIVQDVFTKEVLMMAWMNAESLQMTLEKGEAVFWSRSRKEIWHKGATSGNVQKVVEVRVDCDADTLLVLVEPAGPACHTGERTCFYREIG
jgi:phosphoribosyl-AMP cyclohydrolase/phosphoribosyl-ATP pyrophosphohydrolase/phosphoribosyl-AMP cyclohydrolase